MLLERQVMFPASSTRFANWSPRGAIVLIAILILTIAYGLIAYHPTIPKESKVSDTMLYTRIVERIHDGETYYAVTGEELRKRGYASRSVFNWRLPVLVYRCLPGHWDTSRVLKPAKCWS